MLRATSLKKSYKHPVVKDISLEIGSEIVGLLGPNGAGKTTSFYMIVGLVKPDSGEVFLNDQPITHLPVHQRARSGLGYLPQEPSIFRKLTVFENLMAIMQLRKDLKKPEKIARVNKLMQEFHIDHLKDNIAISLSGGEKRRVEIARALVMEPKYILLDEPFAGIDPISILDIKRIIEQLRSKNIGILITDHNVRETLKACDRAYIVNEGSIIAKGTPQEILSNDTVRKVYLGHEFDL